MTKFAPDQIIIIRYLRGLGLQQNDIAQHLGVSRQVIAYQLKLLRSASIKKGSLPGLKQAGGISPLVGYATAPRHPSSEDDDPDYKCPQYVRMAAYAQMEDLPKHQKIGVLLALLQEVELE